MQDDTTQIIEKVFPGYPADKAGLMVNDVIITTDGQIRGDPGTVLNMIAFRASSNMTLKFRIVRDKICYGERKR